MKRLSALASLAVLGAVVLPSNAAWADQSLCGVRGDIVSKLDEHFREVPAAVGVVDEEAVLEVFVSGNGSWTILATGTDGNSCVLSSGEGWESTTRVTGKDA